MTSDIHKKSHPVTPRQVVSVFDLGYLGVGKDYPEQLSSLPYKKKKNQESSAEEKERNKSHSKKEDSDRAHHLQDEKVQDNGRHIQKQVEKI